MRLFHRGDTVLANDLRAVFIEVIPTPVRAPNANAFMERWIRSTREECLDKLLIINEAHLRRVMIDYVEFFNTARPHQGLDQQIPVFQTSLKSHGQVHCRNVLCGIIHDYPNDFGDLPLIVVTAAESVLHDPPMGNLTPEAFNQAHLEMQAETSKMSTRGQHIIVPQATHMSILSNPSHAQYVIDAIRQLLNE